MMDMENVISDVISAFDEWENNMCCPGEDWSDVHQSRDMVIALLKAQEPHIVTIADYVNNPNVDKDGNLAVWRESRRLNGIAYHNDGWVILNRNRVEGWFNSEMIRFWTSRPTDEQREAIPWN